MNRLPRPENRSKFHEEMFNRHTHAEEVYEINPNEIVYREKDVLKLMRLVKREVLEWAAENAKVKNEIVMNWYTRYTRYTVDKQSILKGKKSKKLKI